MKKKLKIFDYCWHISHQCDMLDALKDDCDFYFCLNANKQWPRDIKKNNLHFVPYYERGTYDLAILHIDQSVINPRILKTIVYHQFNEVITDIPKVVINHGSPIFPEGVYFYDEKNGGSNKELEELCSKTVRRIVGSSAMVVNSHAAASPAEWGFGIPIVHGMNHQNWLDLKKEPRVFTSISPGGFDLYYNRKCLEMVKAILKTQFETTVWHAKVNVSTDVSKQAYKEFLGASLLYLDVCDRTPMNRARTEAFLSGCCVIQVEGAHDLERWAKHNDNIIIVPNDPKEISITVADYLFNRYDEAIEIGQRGKEMAKAEFSPEKYRRRWLDLIGTLVDLDLRD